MKNLYFLFPFSILAFTTILFVSFTNIEIYYAIEGKVVDHNGQPVFNAVVTLDEETTDELTYYEPTNNEGKFVLKFNAVEGRPIQVHIQKEDFLSVREEVIPSTSKQAKELVVKLTRSDHAVTYHPSTEPIIQGKPFVKASILPTH